MRTDVYPSWDYFPRNVRPLDWVEPFIANVRTAEQSISTVDRKTGLDSDQVLQQLAAGLRELGFVVESGKKASERIRRPMLFGSNGHAEVSSEIDAFHDGHGIVVEVETGRGARGNATYRDIIRASLIVDAQFLVLLLPVAYRHVSSGRPVWCTPTGIVRTFYQPSMPVSGSRYRSAESCWLGTELVPDAWLFSGRVWL